MKSLIKCALCLMVAATVAVSATAASAEKLAYRDLSAKIDKDSRKQAKDLEKEGWKVMPGALPIERQMMESKLVTLDENEDGELVNFTATAKSKGGNFNAAKKIAQHDARVELVNNISSNVKDLVSETLSNADLGENDFDAISEFVSANESLSTTLLRGVTVVYETYREQSKYVEVDVRVYISKKSAMETIRNEMKKSLDTATKKLAERL